MILKNKLKINIVIILFLSFSILIPVNKINAETPNAGFVSNSIWYSSNTFDEGDKVKIYTAIFNPDNRELSGTVMFFDNSTLLGKKNFTIPPHSVRDVWVDWTVTIGEHNIFGKIENSKYFISENNYDEVYLSTSQTTKTSRTVNKKISAKIPDTSVITSGISSIINTAGDIGGNSIKSIGEIINENTPSFISSPLEITTNALESFREDASALANNKKEEVKKEIEILNSENKKDETKKSIIDGIEKPLKFTELFALALFSNIFDNKFIFYTLLFLFIFLLLRYIVKRVR